MKKVQVTDLPVELLGNILRRSDSGRTTDSCALVCRSFADALRLEHRNATSVRFFGGYNPCAENDLFFKKHFVESHQSIAVIDVTGATDDKWPLWLINQEVTLVKYAWQNVGFPRATKCIALKSQPLDNPTYHFLHQLLKATAKARFQLVPAHRPPFKRRARGHRAAYRLPRTARRLHDATILVDKLDVAFAHDWFDLGKATTVIAMNAHRIRVKDLTILCTMLPGFEYLLPHVKRLTVRVQYNARPFDSAPDMSTVEELHIISTIGFSLDGIANVKGVRTLHIELIGDSCPDNAFHTSQLREFTGLKTLGIKTPRPTCVGGPPWAPATYK